jgi:Zn-finger nucleic acid-binding protein
MKYSSQEALSIIRAIYNQLMDAGMLECPNCGAPARADAVTCTHCRVQLATVACPACFGMVFTGAPHCSHCGARTFKPAPRTADDGRVCPRCEAALAVSAVGEAFLEECGACGGLWVDPASFQKIIARREQSAAYVGLGSPLPVPGHAVTPDRVRYLHCPDCGKLMNRLNFARHSGVIVDVCKSHGTWFDKDELRQIVEFIQAGGLEAAHEKELEKLKADVERMKDERREAMHPHSSPFATPDDPGGHSPVLEAAEGLLKWLLS